MEPGLFRCLALWQPLVWPPPDPTRSGEREGDDLSGLPIMADRGIGRQGCPADRVPDSGRVALHVTGSLNVMRCSEVGSGWLGHLDRADQKNPYAREHRPQAVASMSHGPA